MPAVFSPFPPCSPRWQRSRTTSLGGAAAADAVPWREWKEVGGCVAQVSSVSRRQRDLCAWVSAERKAVAQFVVSASGLWEQRDFYYGECAGEGATALKKSTVPLCDSKIFREICALYAVGILKQDIGTSIIQKLKQDVWKRQIDSWFVPSLWLYVIHHCQA